MSELPALSPTKIDFNDASRTVLMQKNADTPFLVRVARPGEEMLTGEVAKQGYVAILNPEDEQGKPLYCMTEDEFRSGSIPAVSNQIGNLNDIPSLWFVEALPKRVYFVPESQGPFHLDAPEDWNADKASSDEAHPGWDVHQTMTITTDEGRTVHGYPIVETDKGPIYDQHSFQSGAYKLAIAKPS